MCVLPIMNAHQTIPLFPLKVVVFPGGKLDLQIFERRYIDLVSHCLRSNTGFGICLLRSGDEVVREASKQTIHRAGTYVQIIDWNQLDNGLLGITVQGQGKFSIADCWQSDSGVLEAEVEFSEVDSVDREAIALDPEFEPLAELLQNLERHPLIAEQNLQIDYDNLREVGWRLSEFMPIDVEQKQQLLELEDPLTRIQQLERLVAEMANDDQVS